MPPGTTLPWFWRPPILTRTAHVVFPLNAAPSWRRSDELLRFGAFRSRGPRKRRVGDTLYFVSATSMATALLKQTKGLPLVARKLRIYSSPADIEPARRELHAALQ